jgi:hypothetical protein
MSNLISRIQKLETKLSPVGADMELLYVFNQENIEDALKRYNERERLNYTIEKVKSWSKNIHEDYVMYFPPTWRFENYLIKHKKTHRKITYSDSKLMDKESI